MYEISMQDVFELYQQQVALLSSSQKEKLVLANIEGMEPFVIGCAILRAKQEQRRCREQGRDKRISFNYIHRIIEDWFNHGITSEESFLAYWEAISEDKVTKGVERSAQPKTKFRREDFTYTIAPQNRSFFTFLDD